MEFDLELAWAKDVGMQVLMIATLMLIESAGERNSQFKFYCSCYMGRISSLVDIPL